MASNKRRILVVDDHPATRYGITCLIAEEPDMEVCGHADDVVTAQELVRAERPDLVVLDLSLKHSNGMELISWVRSSYPGINVLVWSASDESLYAERAVRKGACGYINKCEPIEKLIDAMRELLRGGIYLSPAIRRRLLSRMSEGIEQSQDPIASLSDRELDVFRMLGQGMSTQKIAHRMDLNHKTIETYREKIKAKLGLSNTAELIRRAVQWVLENG